MEDKNQDTTKKVWTCPEIFDLSIKKTEGGDYDNRTEDYTGFNIDSNVQ